MKFRLTMGSGPKRNSVIVDGNDEKHREDMKNIFTRPALFAANGWAGQYERV